jgi:hypothetical protein
MNPREQVPLLVMHLYPRIHAYVDILTINKRVEKVPEWWVRL